jgi:hypothetical protein
VDTHSPAKAADNRRPGLVRQYGVMRGMVAGVVYIGLLAAGAAIPVDRIWIGVLPTLAIAAFTFWIWSYATKRTIQDVPTSTVRAAAQGYVELHGAAASLPGGALEAPLTHAPCVWYNYRVVERGEKETRIVDAGVRGTPFLLRDGTGECLIDPRYAYVMCDTVEEWVNGKETYSEWTIRAGDPLYAIGWFRSDDAHAAGRDEAQARLRSWLREPRIFFARFDSNRDGKIARSELDAAHEAARIEGMQGYIAQGGRHRLVSPGDNRPFIVANWPHDRVAEHFGGMPGTHLAVFFAALGFLAYNLA